MADSRRRPIFPSDLETHGYGDDEDAQRLSDQERRDAMARLRDDFVHIFKLPQGERALSYLYGFCHQGEATYMQGDSHETAMREGMRRVYLQIAGFVQMDDERIFEFTRSQTRERVGT